ncbi:ferrous iron transport protein B [Aquabacterium sp.]|jgi:ferrous iron transport protein B|uniref:ferrous iron transport protein B n=1 Tax=Aquabacterium sp. TaxID=1872578 RepID=UPI002488DEEC|nr:ferrous iron transport protein B [Aquabacterium sp.]MDI1350241.1 ferrous iron transport protein B [Aquabacterium sp.]
MATASPDVIHLPTPLIALVGNPNCGKTALFNRLTGARQKVGNYAGVTVERKEGQFISPQGQGWRVLDLPGAYSLLAATPDEAITRDVIAGTRDGEAAPVGLVCVVDATNLRLNLRMVLELQTLGVPMVLAINMMDLAARRGIHIDTARLQAELGIPVVEAVAVRAGGERALLAQLDQLDWAALPVPDAPRPMARIAQTPVETTHRRVGELLATCVTMPDHASPLTARLDRHVLHPVFGPLILAALMFLVFQAVFSWAQAPMDFIDASMGQLGDLLKAHMPEGMLRSLLIEGVIGGAGSVLVFLPQIIILFGFILALEDSGYLPRAAFLLDRVMASVGLSGRAFIPLLSSFACAVPGIMATRTIADPRDRLVTILIAPLMTCSARLPVYAMLIAAFIPDREVGGLFNLQGLVLFALYMAGIVSAMVVALVLKRFMKQSAAQPLLMELPDYHVPHLRNLALGLWERTAIFVKRVGTIILSLMIVLWFLSNFPAPPAGATGPAIEYSLAGMLGRALEVVFSPIGFTWQICIALVPGMAAREVAVAALGTVYAMSQTGDELSSALVQLIGHAWSLPTALSLMTWYVFAPQCLSTVIVVKRETNGWRMPLLMLGYLFALAYGASFLVYHTAMAWGL